MVRLVVYLIVCLAVPLVEYLVVLDPLIVFKVMYLHNLPCTLRDHKVRQVNSAST
jgi:hypothetical protein